MVLLNRNDFDFNERECIVFGKGSKERVVYFDARTKILLQNYLMSRTDDNPALFVSLKSPYERLKIGQKINIMVKSVNREDGRIILSYKEMLGTWEENAKLFTAGMKAHGIVRETEKNKNGIFIELMPNLVGMAEYEEGLEYGQKVDVYIKKIDYERKKVKLLVV